MKHKRISTLVLTVLILLLTVPSVSAATDIVEPTESLYCADYADILDSKTEAWIVSQSTALKEQCGGEVAVVTIDFLNDLDSEEYCYELLNQWGVGDSKKNNGTVLLLVPGEGKGWITRGTGLEDYLTDAKLDTILNRYLWDDFDAENYDRAVTNTVSAVLEQYESYYNIDLSAAAQSTAYQQSTNTAAAAGAGILASLAVLAHFLGCAFWSILFWILAALFVIAFFSSIGSNPNRRMFFFFGPRWGVARRRWRGIFGSGRPGPGNRGGYHNSFHNGFGPGNGFGSGRGGFGGSNFGGRGGGFGGGHGGSFGGGSGRGGGAGRR